VTDHNSNELCVGCSYCGGLYRSNLKDANDSGQCPCTLCIVKCICNSPCPEFIAFKTTIMKGIIRHD